MWFILRASLVLSILSILNIFSLYTTLAGMREKIFTHVVSQIYTIILSLPPPPSHTHIGGHQPIFICFLNNYQIAYSFSTMFLYVNNFACFKNNKLCLTCHSTTWSRQKKNTGKKSFLSSDC